MRGDASLGMGRPKFLSDQIFNKVLLRSMYPSNDNYSNDAGTNEYINYWRGRIDGNVEASFNESNTGNEDYKKLTYPFIDKDGIFSIRQKEFLTSMAHIIKSIGSFRFDTTIIRNLFFIVNVLWITRLKLNRELTSSRNIVINSHYAVNPTVTEYGVDPFGSNEIYTSKRLDGQSRYDNM